MPPKKSTTIGTVLTPLDTNQEALLPEARNQKRKAISLTPQDDVLDQEIQNLETRTIKKHEALESVLARSGSAREPERARAEPTFMARSNIEPSLSGPESAREPERARAEPTFMARSNIEPRLSGPESAREPERARAEPNFMARSNIEPGLSGPESTRKPAISIATKTLAKGVLSQDESSNQPKSYVSFVLQFSSRDRPYKFTIKKSSREGSKDQPCEDFEE
jgi:hypothetical protein